MMLLRSPDETSRIGAALARQLAHHASLVIYLEGPLGAGKTTLARGFLRELGVTGTIRSPTYTLVEPYEALGRTILHLDLYRLQDPRELEPLGLRDYAGFSWWLVEWPERAGGRLPPADVCVTLAHDAAGRHMELFGPAVAEVRV